MRRAAPGWARRAAALGALLLAVLAAPAAGQEGRRGRISSADLVRLIEAGRLGLAEHVLRQQLDGDETPDVHYLLGVVLLRQFRYAEAEGHLRRAVAARPERAAWQQALAESLAAQGRCASALAVLDRCLELAPEARLHYEKALCALDLGDGELAERELLAAVDRGWSRPEAFVRLGIVAADRGDDATARRWLERALAAAPGHPEATFQLGLVARRAGDLEAAAEAFAAVVERVSGHAGALYNLGAVLRALGRDAEAAAALARFQEASRVAERIEEARAYLALDPTAGEVRQRLAGDLLAAGRTDEAVHELEAQRRATPSAAAVHALLAEAYAQQGREAEAAAAAAAARQLGGAGAEGE